MAHDLFISYAIEDRQTADTMCELFEKSGIACWYAPRDVPFGADYEEAIIDAISDSRLLVLILSSHSNSSLHVRREIQNACSNETPRPILPVRIDNVPLNRALRYYLSSAQWLDASTPPLENHLQRLVEQLRSQLSRPAETADPLTPPDPERRQSSAKIEHTLLSEIPSMGRTVKEKANDLHLDPGVLSIQSAALLANVTTEERGEPQPIFDLRRFWRSSELVTVLLVFASFLFLWAGLLIVVIPFADLATKDLIGVTILIFLIVEGIVTYIYMRRSRNVRWWWLSGVLVVTMTSVVAGFFAYSKARLDAETTSEVIDPTVKKSPTTTAYGVVMFEGAILPGVEVKLLQSPFPNPVGTSTTDVNGEYHFKNLTRNNVYSLVVAPSSKYDGKTVMLIPDQENYQRNIELKLSNQ